MESSEQAKEEAAITICQNIIDYSIDEIINAVRYLGRIGNVSELQNLFFPEFAISLERAMYDLTYTEKSSVIKLEAIKQFEFLDDLSILYRIIEFPATFPEVLLHEIVRIAGNKEYFPPLQLIIQNPKNFTEELRKRANEELFKPRIQSQILTTSENTEKSNAPGRDLNANTEPSTQKQVFISYKKTDQIFADEVVSYLSEFYSDEFEILYDEFEVVAGDSLPKALNSMLDRSETSMTVWSLDYFSEVGWAVVEKDGILSKRVREGKRFVPLFLRGESSIIPTIFSQYVYVDFREYEKNKDPVLFRKQMEKVIVGLRK